MTIDGREVGGKSSSSYELSSFARHGAADPQVGAILYFIVYTYHSVLVICDINSNTMV